ncbi:MAG TPA: MotA/TolQ/ExbB proton channel family protein [Candidatus Azoamicus sp. OHIO1]
MNFFIKFFVFLLCMILIFALIFISNKYRIFNRYIKEILSFDKEFNDKNIDLKEFYNKLLIRKSNVIGLSVIFFSGFKEFIYLHRKGISDVIVVAKMVKHVMNISMRKEIELLRKNIYYLTIIKSIVLYLSVLGTILGIIIFFQKLNINLDQNISYPVIISGIIESLLPIVVGLFIVVPVDIFYKKYLDCLCKVSMQYKIFIDEFIILLYHKLYN